MIKPTEKIALFQPAVDTINAQLCNLLHGDARKVWQRKMKRLIAAGVPEALANTVAGSASLYASLGIAEAARTSNATEKEVAEVYFGLGETLELDWMNQQVADIKIENHWQALARESFRDDIEWQQSSLTSSVLNFVRHEQDLKRGIESWIACQTEMVGRWRTMITELQQTEVQEFAMFSVATRELLDLAQNSLHCSVPEGENQTPSQREGDEVSAELKTTKPKTKRGSKTAAKSDAGSK
jgi:glutamate dehydrogenase